MDQPSDPTFTSHPHSAVSVPVSVPVPVSASAPVPVPVSVPVSVSAPASVSASRRNAQPKLRPPKLAVPHRDAPAVCLRDAFRDGEPEARAACGSSACSLPVAIEDRGALRFGNSRATVLDLDLAFPLFDLDAKADVSASRRELQRVCEKIVDGLPELLRIGGRCASRSGMNSSDATARGDR